MKTLIILVLGLFLTCTSFITVQAGGKVECPEDAIIFEVVLGSGVTYEVEVTLECSSNARANSEILIDEFVEGESITFGLEGRVANTTDGRIFANSRSFGLYLGNHPPAWSITNEFRLDGEESISYEFRFMGTFLP